MCKLTPYTIFAFLLKTLVRNYILRSINCISVKIFLASMSIEAISHNWITAVKYFTQSDRSYFNRVPEVCLLGYQPFTAISW